jgi:primosomal protein N' (replication factor Y)
MGRPPFQDLFVLTVPGVDEAVGGAPDCMRLRLGLEDWTAPARSWRRWPQAAGTGPGHRLPR